MMKKQILLLTAVVHLLSCDKQEKDSDLDTKQLKKTSENKIALIVAVGKVEPESEVINLSAPVGGIVRAIFKKDGDTIVNGDPLIQLDDDIEQSKINEIKTQMQSQRLQIEIEQIRLKEAEINLGDKRLLLAKSKRLATNGAETQQYLDDLTNEIKVLEVSLERLKSNIQLASSKRNELEAQFKTATMEASKKRFFSPFNGTLLDIQVNKGEAINQFSSYAEIAPQGNLIVRAEVDELFSSQLKIGQKVEIQNTGSDNIIAIGEIGFIAPYLKKKSLFSEKADDQEDRRVREIRINILGESKVIINSKVECKIKL